MPRHKSAERRRAWEGFVLVRTEVDRRPDEQPELERAVDGEVVGPVRDIAEHQDDDHEPDERLEASPRPAVSVEQTEERAPLRHDETGPEGGTGRPRSAHPAIRVPVMFGWTEQLNV